MITNKYFKINAELISDDSSINLDYDYVKENKKDSSIGSIMMSEIFEDDYFSFYSKSQDKTSNMNSFEMTHPSFEIFKMLNSNNIHTSKLHNLLLQSNEQRRIFTPELLHNLLDICGVYFHNDLHHLLNSSTVMDLPKGFLSIFFNFSTYSFFIGNSSTGCQSIFSQNF